MLLFWYLLLPSKMNAVNIRKLQKDILKPVISEEGLNGCAFEGQAYSQFVKYMREEVSKTVIESSIITFCFLVLTSPHLFCFQRLL